MRFNPEEYITVAERIVKFYEKHREGKILTAIVEHDREAGFVLMRAEVYRNAGDELPAATGHAYEVKGGSGPNATSHIENCETGAVGRALVNLGLEVKRQPEPAKRQPPRQQKPEANARQSAEYAAALTQEITQLIKDTGTTDKAVTERANTRWDLTLHGWQGASLDHKEKIAAGLRLEKAKQTEVDAE